MERISTYRGREVEITYDRGRCIHAAECGRGSKELFDIRKDPWCEPDAVAAEEAIAVVARCPSGALKVRRLDGQPASVDGEGENVVSVYPDGPLYFSGQLEIEGVDEEVGARVALCRCGASKEKPFCDGSHSGVGFKDAGPVASDPDPATLPSGPLRITPVKNGPLVTSGPMTLRAGSGRVALRVTKSALCRCGASENKPFCDGSHGKVDFVAD